MFNPNSNFSNLLTAKFIYLQKTATEPSDWFSAKHMQFKIHRYVSIYILYTLDRKIDTHKYLVPDRG